MKIFKEIVKLKENSYLIIVGSGRNKKKLNKFINNNNLVNKVKIVEKRNDIANILSMIDIYVSTSVFKGFGLTLVESQVNGLKVFCSSNCAKNIIISNRLEFINLKIKPFEIAKKIVDSNYKRERISLKDTCKIEKFINNIDYLYKKNSL